MSQRSCILHLRASNFVGGPERQLLRYAEYEREGPFEVIVGTFAGHGEGDELLEAAHGRGFSTLALDGGISGTGPAFFRLVRFLREQEISLVCSHGYKADIVGTLACRVRGIPIVWFLRGWTAEDSKIRLYEALDRALLPLATRVVCLSQARAHQLSNHWRMAQKVRVVPNVIEPPDFTEEDRVQARRRLRERFGLADDTRVVAAAARFSREKGLSDLLEAAAEVSREFTGAHFVLFGDGPLRPQLEEQAKRLGLQSVVHFPGFVATLPDLLPGVDVVVNPSLSEEMPNIVLEGMAATIPVVATAVGGVAELAGDGPGLVLLPSADPAALAKAVADVLRDPVRARGLARAGYERVREAFSPARQRERLHALYEELILGNVSTQQSFSTATAEVTLPKDHPSNNSLSPAPVPYISVVIPIHNEGAYVGAALEDLLRQEYPANRYEILVADGNSTDRTAEVIDRYAERGIPRIVRLPNPAGLSSAGRNVGVQQSRGELIIFVDGHCRILSSRLLLDTVRTFQSTGADCLCRPQPLLFPGSTAFQNVVAHARASALGHGLDSTIYGMNREGFVNPMSSGAIYHRRVFDRVGLYDERFDACEDVEFNYRVFRAGLRSYLSPRLAVFYSPRTNPVGLWKQMVRYGRGRFRLMCKHPSAGSFSQLVPGALVAWLVTGGLASLWSSQAAFVLALTLLGYGAVVLSFSTQLGLRHGWRHFVMAPAVYLTIHFGLGAGFWAEAARFLLEPLQRLRRRPQQVSPSVIAVGTPRPPSTGAAREAFEPEMKEKEEVWVLGHRHKMLNALTVDVEDYFHTEALASLVGREQWDEMPPRVLGNTRRLLELLAKHNVRATFFFLGWVAERFPQLVRETAQAGHELSCHSYWHRPIHCLPPAEFRTDTQRAKQAVEDAAGIPVRGYRAPSFSLVPGTEWAAEILVELGFSYDSSMHPIRHDLYSNHRAPRRPHRIASGALLELPVATLRLGGTNLPIGGGGYLRLLPYTYTRWGLTRLNQREGLRAVVYLHPWEVDPEQPRLHASWKSRLRQYTALRRNEQKIERLLGDFRFAPIAQVFQQEITAAPRANQPGRGLETAPVTSNGGNQRSSNGHRLSREM